MRYFFPKTVSPKMVGKTKMLPYKLRFGMKCYILPISWVDAVAYPLGILNTLLRAIIYPCQIIQH